MAVLFGPSPVTLRVNQNPNVSPALQIADDVINLRATLSHWNGTATASVSVDLSFDAGQTWTTFQVNGPTTSPSGQFKNKVDLTVEMAPVWRRCGFTFPADSRYRPGQVCGENYQPNMPWNGKVTVHSDWAFQDTTPLPGVYDSEGRIVGVNYHNPDLAPVFGGPLRQVRSTMIVSGNVSSQLTVESF